MKDIIELLIYTLIVVLVVLAIVVPIRLVPKRKVMKRWEIRHEIAKTVENTLGVLCVVGLFAMLVVCAVALLADYNIIK